MAFRSAATTAGTGASQSAPTPAGFQANDYLGLWIVTDDFSKSPTATGFTQRADASISLPDGQSARLLDKIATGSEGASVPVTNLATGNSVIIMFALSGRSTTAPRTFTPHVSTNTSNNSSPITISDTVTGTGAAGDDQIWMVMVDTRGVAGWVFGNSLAGWTRQVNQDDTWTPAGLYSRDNVAGGAIGTLSTTATNAGNTGGWGAVVISIAQATGGGAVSFVPQNNEFPRRAYSFPAKHLQQAIGLAAMLPTPPVHEAYPALRSGQRPAIRDTTNEVRAALAAQQAAVGADASYPFPGRYPALRLLGVDPLAALRYFPQVEATQPGPRPFALERAVMVGAEAFPGPTYVPEVEAFPALFGWRPGPNRDRGSDVAPPLTAGAPVPSADPALAGWRPPPNRERGADVAPPLIATAPVPNADPALTGWRVPLNRAAGAETPPPLLATQPVPNTDQPRRGWQPPPNRDAGAIPVPPVVYAPPTEAKTAEFGWRRIANRDRGVDGLPAPSSLPSFPDVPAVWEFTRQAPPLRVKEGVTPLAAVRATGPVGDVTPVWRSTLRSFPGAAGAEPQPPLTTGALAPFGEAPFAAPERYAPVRPSTPDALPPLVSPPVGFVSDAPQRASGPPRVGPRPDPWPLLLADWAPPNDAPVLRAPRLRVAEQPQAFAPIQIKPWGYEAASPRQPTALRAKGNDGFALGSVTIYHLLPWIWEAGPLWGGRQRNRAADQATGDVLFGFAVAHGPIRAVSFANQLATIGVTAFANQRLTVTLTGFADQIASIQVVRFDENE